MAWLRQFLPHGVRVWLWEVRNTTAALGVWGALVYAYRRTHPGLRGRSYRLHPRRVKHPLHVRYASSDADVLRQIFLEGEYVPLCGMTDVRLVVDCGANVGYSSAFFLSQFPSCHVVAVEPAPDNFAMLQRNLYSYGERVKLLRAGMWSHRAPLTLSRGAHGDGREWATQVRLCSPDEQTDVEGVDVQSLLADSGFDRIGLLKVDIEGAEAIMFRDNPTWLDKVDTIAIELHDDTQFGDARDIVLSAVRARGFELSRNGELTICRRRGAQMGAN